jgi:hypothetical protein
MQGLSYLITYREAGSDERRDNLLAVISWLRQWPEIEVVVVEQDAVPRLDSPLEYGGGVARFAYNPGPFNKAWGLNVAVGFARGPLLAIGDADVIAPETFAVAAARCRDVAAVKPYRSIVDLTPAETERVRGGEWALQPARSVNALPNREGQGEHVVFAGGLFLSGFDERFRGWGGEDDAMTQKLRRCGVPVAQIAGPPALHLWHPRSPATTFGHRHYADNLALLEAYQGYSDAEFARLCEVGRQAMGNLHKYRPVN